MKRSKSSPWILSAAALMVGGGLLAHALGQTASARARLERRVQDLEQLRIHKDTLRTAQQARVHLRETASPKPKRLAEVAAGHLNARTIDVQRLEPRTVDAGWRQQRAELTFNGATWSNLDAFLTEAEASRPPWVLESCTLDAQPDGSGSGRLVLQALERISP